MPSPPRVSVLMPAYNAASTLPRAVESILRQTMGDLEFVAVNDGSTDETLSILHRYASDDERLRIIDTPHGGIVPALNAGLAAARGALVARMDADDWSHPDRLRLQCNYLETHADIDLVSCAVDFGGCRESCAGYAEYVDWINALLTPEAIATHRFRESPLAHPSVMFRKECIDIHGGYRDGPFPEDYELWLRWLGRGVRMGKCEETLLTWSDPPSRLSRTHANYAPAAFQAMKAPYLAAWLEANNPFHPWVCVVGAGQVGRKRARLLLEHGVRIRCWIDIDPRKIGQAYQGVPVVSRQGAPGPEEAFVLSYVASRHAHAQIAAWLEGRGFVAGRSYLLAA